ncbi:SLBB domain-containing protein, partial [Candidatus Bipolaricaulota bacterium]|nr:SLBB domain-containing protein [Candidatus Bipolaricaulota bacterium]
MKRAGVVGAGGAGFPTHVKLQARVDTVIANGAECEPLLACDKVAMQHQAALLCRGLDIVKQVTGADRAVIALKSRDPKLLTPLRKAADEIGAEIFLLADVYPAGDEQVTVFEVTGRIVPESGLPLDVGCVVDNVITLINVARAVDDGQPVTDRLLTIHGEVHRPVTVSLPIGTPFHRALEIADGPRLDSYVILEGGPVMGPVVTDMEVTVKKTTSGLIVLSPEHPLVRRKLASIRREVQIGASVCCQCRMCTDLCPRFLLGHEIHPHLVMRSSMHSGYRDAAPEQVTNAYLCCDCGVCELIACPLDLSPRKVNMSLRQVLAANGIANPHRRREVAPHPQRRHRMVPTSRLVARLGLAPYYHEKAAFDA